jgi:serine/threonine protein kinase/WD40 repeat protein
MFGNQTIIVTSSGVIFLLAYRKISRVSNVMYNLQSIRWDNLHIEKKLSEGSFATVYLGRWQGGGGGQVAVKQLNVPDLKPDISAEFERQAKLHAQYQQVPRIVRLFGITQEPGHFALIMEYMPKGSLYDVLHDRKIDLPWPTRWQIAIDIGAGLAFLHGVKILHQDLTSLNVLLDDSLRAKIRSFGQSSMNIATQASDKSTDSLRWRAPETFKDGFKYNEAADVYSYGVILWEIAKRALPFSDVDNDEMLIGLLKDGKQEEISPRCPPAYAAAITDAWKPAASRSSADVLARGLQASQPAAADASAVVKQPWHFDPEKRSDGVTLRGYELFPAGREDFYKVWSSYFSHSVPGYDIVKIDVIHNPDLNRAYAARLNLLQNRHGNPAFSPSFDTEGTAEERAHRQRIDCLHQQMTAPFADSTAPNVRIMPAWHGTDAAVLDSVFQTGFANLATTDSGFFGKGLYTTGEADYAHRVYATQNGSRAGALLMAWSSCYSALPVIGGDGPKLSGKGNYKNYDAHFAPVRPRDPSNPREVNYDPCKPGEPPEYTEMVVFDPSQCLPRYLVHLIPSPLTIKRNRLLFKRELDIDDLSSYAWSPNSQRLALGNVEGELKIYSIDGDCLRTFDAEMRVWTITKTQSSSSGTDLRLPSDFTIPGEGLACENSLSMYKNMERRDERTGSITYKMNLKRDPLYFTGITCCAWNSKSDCIVVGDDNDVVIWDVERSRKVIKLRDLGGTCGRVIDTEFGNVALGKTVGHYEDKEKTFHTPVVGCAWSLDGKSIIALSKAFYETSGSFSQPGKKITIWGVPNDYLQCHDINYAYYLVSEDKESGEYCCKGSTAKCCAILSAAFSPNSQFLVFGTECGKVVLVNYQYPKEPLQNWADGDIQKSHRAKTIQYLFQLKGHTGQVTFCAWSPDGRRIASISIDNTLRVWDSSNGTCLVTIDESHPIKCCTWSHNGKYLVVVSEEKQDLVWLLDSTTGQRFFVFDGIEPLMKIISCHWDASGKFLAAIAKICDEIPARRPTSTTYLILKWDVGDIS